MALVHARPPGVADAAFRLPRRGERANVMGVGMRRRLKFSTIRRSLTRAERTGLLAGFTLLQGACNGHFDTSTPLGDAAPDAPSSQTRRDDGPLTLFADDAAGTANGGTTSDIDASCTLDPVTGALVLSESDFCSLNVGDPPCERDVVQLRQRLPACSTSPRSLWTRTVGCGVESIGYSGGYTGATNYFDEATGEWIGAEAFTDVGHGPCDPGSWQTGRIRPPCPDEVTEHCVPGDAGGEGGSGDAAR